MTPELLSKSKNTHTILSSAEWGRKHADEFVRALLAGKTQIRLLDGLEKINKHPNLYAAAYQDGGGRWIFWSSDQPCLAEFTKRAYPHAEGIASPYAVGDVLAVKEAWRPIGPWNCKWRGKDRVEYRADGTVRRVKPDRIVTIKHDGWWGATTMPDWAVRLRLEVTGVWCEKNADGLWVWVYKVKRIEP